MGYPNKRVSMTDVHGEPQQGGYLPAEIWHDYMSAVTEGQPCVRFPEPKEPISYQPFFGKYASTGRSTQSNESARNEAETSSRKASSRTATAPAIPAAVGAQAAVMAGRQPETAAARSAERRRANPTTPAHANAPREPATAAPGGGGEANGDGGHPAGAGAGR